ncbi:hypothetical protein HY572_00855 [Candidatus Micrarchaeota archaeon]|nr:hypothetical protein [Candidatus Micrarchaeota archaeon]
MEPKSTTPKEAYIEGRLMGLNELVAVLKDAVKDQKADHADITKSIVEHIARETHSIVQDVHGELSEEHADKIAEQNEKFQKQTQATVQAVEKKPDQAASAVKKNVETADALMKNLMALQNQ